ncbi:MAG: hypothetical protein KDE01_14355, partial [Caldilineaceae bacterium]|nr:hypothetical protein [Caldilineaceae bacterium]
MHGNGANGGRGGGVYAGGTAALAGGAIHQNTSTRGGGGIYAAQTLSLSSVDVLSNTTTDNGPFNVGYGGGVYVQGSATFSGGLFQNNQCTHSTCGGGGVYAMDTLMATDTIFR